MHRREFIAATIAAGMAVGARAADSQEKKYRVALIGHKGRGDFGHGLDTMWLNVPRCEIVGVANPVPAGLATWAEKLGDDKMFADYRQMLTTVKPDLVAIGMRHIDQHRDAVLAAVEAGARGIYIEKPFCRTPAEADEIVSACQDRKVKLAVAHRNRYHPVLPTIDRLVEEGAIGQLLEIRARGKEDARGGGLDLWVLGSHLLNLVHYFAGAPVACSAVMLRDGRPATRDDVFEGGEGVGPLAGNEVHARYEMETGIPAFFDSKVKAGNPKAGFGLQLLGTEGVIDLRIDQEPLAQILPGSPFRPTSEARSWTPISSAGIGQPEPDPQTGRRVMSHVAAADDLIAAIEEDRPPLCSATDGRVTVEMITAVFESHRHNGARISWPLTTRDNPLTHL